MVNIIRTQAVIVNWPETLSPVSSTPCNLSVCPALRVAENDGQLRPDLTPVRYERLREWTIRLERSCIAYHLMLHGWVISWWVISIKSWLDHTVYDVAKRHTRRTPKLLQVFFDCFLTVCFSMFLSFVNALTLLSVIDAMEVGLDTLSWCLQ